MKKSLVALAVLAASGASFAQSSVTLYGIADIWLGSVRTDDGVTSQTQTKVDSGGVNTSRWGIKGSEDLGGGLSAVFKLEQGFKLDTGAGDTAGQAFSRQAYVGFAGGFGEVAVGKVWSAYDDVSGASNAMFDSGALAPMYAVFQSTNYFDRPANGFRYTSPEMGGFTGAVSYSLDEDVVGATSIASLALSYAAGPLAVQLGYQDEDINGVADDTKYLRLGGTYDFGVAVAKLTYGKVTDIGNVNGDDADEYQVGVDVPVGSAIVVSASYARSEDDKDVGYESTRDGYGIGATYTLSKRTFLYGGYTYSSATQQAADDATSSAFAVGVQHRF